jgi:hypothetical protein
MGQKVQGSSFSSTARDTPELVVAMQQAAEPESNALKSLLRCRV